MANDMEELNLELPEGLVEETETDTEPITSVFEVEAEDSPEQKPEEEPRSEPGYVRGRIDKAVARAVAETEARMRAEFEKTLAPIREQQLTNEAEKLVAKGDFKTVELAKEYLQLKQGVAPTEQPRNERGQYVEDSGTKTRISMLQHQADTIKAEKGPDVIAEFQRNPAVKEKVISGEWDFYDVAKAMRQKRPPAPMRSPNGASGQKNSILDMSDAAFERLEKEISEGKRFTFN